MHDNGLYAFRPRGGGSYSKANWKRRAKPDSCGDPTTRAWIPLPKKRVTVLLDQQGGPLKRRQCDYERSHYDNGAVWNSHG